MPPKQKTPAPIDRPLSRAYLREFSGWSTAYPPGLSEPTSLRKMENVQVNRDGSVRVRPGLRYLSYAQAPNDDIGLSDQVVGVTSGDNDIVLPADVQAGDQVVVFVQSPVAASTHTLNGYTMQAESQIVRGGGVWDYRLQVLTKVAESQSPGVPTLGIVPDAQDPSNAHPDALWVACVVRGSTTVDVSIDQRDNATSFAAPAATPGMQSIRVWGVCNEFMSLSTRIQISPSEGETVAQSGVSTMAHILAVADTGEGPVTATTTGGYNAGWMAATLNFESKFTGSGVAGGVAYDRPFVGTHEPFYLADGTRAYLVAVREVDETVGFRVMILDANESAVYELTDPRVDFDLPTPATLLNFSADTTYVKYLQIDNKIYALSDNGEPMRLFHVGLHKKAKALNTITVPGWSTEDKLTVVHPDAAWINGRVPTKKRVNKLTNPSFEKHLDDWIFGGLTKGVRSSNATPVSGTRVLRLESLPTRTNLVPAPLHNVAGTGVTGWFAETPGVALAADASYLKVTVPPGREGYSYARSRMATGVEGGEDYKVAFDYEIGEGVDARCVIRFLGITGTEVGAPSVQPLEWGAGRWVSSSVRAPKGCVTMRVVVGAQNATSADVEFRIKNVVLCKADEPTGIFSGSSGTNYFWTGTVNKSASVYHPPVEVSLTAVTIPVYSTKLNGSLHVTPHSTARSTKLDMRIYDKSHQLMSTATSGTSSPASGSWTRLSAAFDPLDPLSARADLHLTIQAVPRGEYHYVDAAMIEPKTATADTYFDGSLEDTATVDYFYTEGGAQLAYEYGTAAALPTPQAKTTNTLIAAGGPSKNQYNYGFFYSFSNEVGESQASQITQIRASRPWSAWLWETPDPTTGDPSGTETDNPDLACDQLVAYMPQEVFDAAVVEGATSWSLYMFTWSDQDPVPVVAMKVAERQLDTGALYANHGWARVSAAQTQLTTDAVLPAKANVYNYSRPSSAAQGLVAGDRLVLVNDPASGAVIRWSSNRMGEYTNFTASRGGGFKTLTTGNLYIPACVKLWQNPESKDTLTILTLGTDGESASYYMAPAQVSSQSDVTTFMAFEETTATPGTVAPYGVEVLNNALYHPLEHGLMKSTASNYNISHKMMTDTIADQWAGLAMKYWIISAQLDNRLYYLVNNLDGDPLEVGCKGNEIWVYDTAKEGGTWSRFRVQATTLRKLEFGDQVHMSVVRPDGVYYLDVEYGMDDYVASDLGVSPRAIPWKFETNTQGANRAHDAWAHLQQVTLTLGSFTGTLRYGVRGWDVHGKPIDVDKIVQDKNPAAVDGLPWDLEDHLQVRRDMKEWHFYAESVEGAASAGQVNLVQYRYTPVSVNVGYEYGSVETFEYTRNVASGNDGYSANGIPVPAVDQRRP